MKHHLLTSGILSLIALVAWLTVITDGFAMVLLLIGVGVGFIYIGIYTAIRGDEDEIEGGGRL